MAQPSSKILTVDMLDHSDFRQQFVEVATHADDFATAETSLILATVPFLAAGDSFADVPLYPVGLTQSFTYNESLLGQFTPELGSYRKIGISGSSMGSGTISRLTLHGNSLAASLYRPALIFLGQCESLKDITDRIAGTSSKQWIQALSSQDIDLFSANTDEYMDRVIAKGGLNGIMYKIPFGLIEVQRDPRQRVTAINFFEQCMFKGTQGGLSAGQFQLIEGMSFEYERLRPLKAVGPFSLSSDTTKGM